MMQARTLLICLAALFITAAAFAGMGVTMRCTNCNFSSQVNLGGGMGFHQHTGYCANCEKFVYLSWNRGEQEPAPLARVWDSATGRTIPVFSCPQCAKPFLLLQSELEYCPRCGKKTLEQDKSAGTIMYD